MAGPLSETEYWLAVFLFVCVEAGELQKRLQHCGKEVVEL